MNRLLKILAAVYGECWAILPERLEAFEAALLAVAQADRGALPTEQRGGRPHPLRIDRVAVLPLYDTLSPRMNLVDSMSGGTSTQIFQGWLAEALNDSKVGAIVLDVDSPGGTVTGTRELGEAVFDARQKKPVIAVATGMMASAAYWIGSAASHVVGSPSADVGSIGVVLMHRDYSGFEQQRGVRTTFITAGKYKAELNASEPLSAEARAYAQERVNSSYTAFLQAVATHRNTTPARVESDFGQGRMFRAPEALQRGMIDRVAALPQVVGEWNQQLAGRTTVAVGGPKAKESVMNPWSDPQVLEALIGLGLVQAGATPTAEVLETIGRAFLAGRGQQVPGDARQLVVLLSTPAAAPAAPAAAAVPAPVANGRVENPPAPNGGLGNPPSATTEAERQAGRVEERNRQRGIRERAVQVGIDAATAEQWIEDGLELNQVNDRIVGHLTQTRAPLRRVEHVSSGIDTFGAAAVEALFSQVTVPDRIRRPDGEASGVTRRGNHAAPAATSDLARRLSRMSALQIIRASLETHGIRAEMASDDEQMARWGLQMVHSPYLIEGANAGGLTFNTPGAFPNILSNLQNKMLDEAPQWAETTYREWATQLPSAGDMKVGTIHRLGSAGQWPEKQDNKSFEQAQRGEEYALITTDPYGVKEGLTPRMVVNDDLGAFLDLIMDLLIAGDETINWGLLELLVNTSDTFTDGTVFWRDTGGMTNVVASGAGGAPSTDQLHKMRLVLRGQKGVGNNRRLSGTLRQVLVPAELETKVEQALGPYPQYAATEATVPVFRGRVDSIIVEPRLGDFTAYQGTQAWFGFGSQRMRSFVYRFLRGQERPVTNRWYDPDTQNLWMSVSQVVGWGRGNWRGVVRNHGS